MTLKKNSDFREIFFSSCNWNINLLAKDNFQRVQLLEAHNSIFSYDLISLTEVSLNDNVTLPDTILDDYKFVFKSNIANTRHGGVGLLYRNSLPCSIRHDLGFNQAIVVELSLKRKKIFYTVLCRSPSNLNGSPEFDNFCKTLRTYTQR